MKIPNISIENILSISNQINANKGRYIFKLEKEYPVAINMYAFNYNFKLAPNYHDFLEIDYVLDGKGILNISNKKYQFKKDDIIIIGSNELHTFLKYDNEKFTLSSLFFLPEVIYKLGGNEFDFDFLKPFFYSGYDFNPVISRENNNAILKSFEKIYLFLRSKNKNFKLEVKFL